jgi:hypothetical protein
MKLLSSGWLLKEMPRPSPGFAPGEPEAAGRTWRFEWPEGITPASDAGMGRGGPNVWTLRKAMPRGARDVIHDGRLGYESWTRGTVASPDLIQFHLPSAATGRSARATPLPVFAP